MLGLQLIYVSKRGPGMISSMLVQQDLFFMKVSGGNLHICFPGEKSKSVDV